MGYQVKPTKKSASSVGYRIVGVGILIKMFKEKRNYLSSPRNWLDQWEQLDIDLKAQKETEQFEKIRSKLFAQCWSAEGYSWALWKMNSPFQNGVRIKTRFDKLYKSLPREIKEEKNQLEIIRRVEYLTEEEIRKKIRKKIKQEGVKLQTITDLFFLKRRAFEYETETRLILPNLAKYSCFQTEKLGEKKFISYKCDPCSYIESIYFDSKIDPYLYDVFRSIIKDFGFNGQIGKSGLDKKPTKIRIR
jgi:hypothetical protein